MKAVVCERDNATSGARSKHQAGPTGANAGTALRARQNFRWQFELYAIDFLQLNNG